MCIRDSPGELLPKKAINDFYQLATGGSGAAAAELPSMASIGDSVAVSGDEREGRFNTPPSPPEFVTPSKGKPPVSTTVDSVDLSDGSVTQIDNSTNASKFTISGRTEGGASNIFGQKYINDKPVSLEEYTEFLNMSEQEQASKYGQ